MALQKDIDTSWINDPFYVSTPNSGDEGFFRDMFTRPAVEKNDAFFIFATSDPDAVRQENCDRRYFPLTGRFKSETPNHESCPRRMTWDIETQNFNSVVPKRSWVSGKRITFRDADALGARGVRLDDVIDKNNERRRVIEGVITGPDGVQIFYKDDIDKIIKQIQETKRKELDAAWAAISPEALEEFKASDAIKEQRKRWLEGSWNIGEENGKKV